MLTRFPIVRAAFGLFGLSLAIGFGDLEAAPIRGLEGAPANTWVKLTDEATGGRDWPMFYFDPTLKAFVLSAGGFEGPAHYDTEIFDGVTWKNAYPKGVLSKAESGPTDAPKAVIGDKDVLKAGAHGVQRILRSLNPYLREPGTYHQWAYAPEQRKLIAYFADRTLAFDSNERQWSDLNVPRFNKAGDHPLIYGSLAYDPVNKEILSIGGTSDEDGGSPGTWAFNLSTNVWGRVPAGSPELKELSARAATLRRQTAAFVNACRNRFYQTENDLEAKADLDAKANLLGAQTIDFWKSLQTVKLNGAERNAPHAAAQELFRTIDVFKPLGGKTAIDTKYLLDAQTLLDAAERVERTLDAEPCGRGVSQMAVDTRNGKIVLFGGCRLNGYLADTWVYDCKTRSWEQRYPKISPSPRCGHTLAFLPKSGKIVLYGSTIFSSPYGIPFGNPRPPQELWTYDVAANEWKLLADQAKERPIDCIGAVDADDNLIVVSRDPKNRQRRQTWGMKVDPLAADVGSAKVGVAAGAVTLSFSSPSDFDKATTIDAAAAAKILKSPAGNQWSLMPEPPRKRNDHPWGTSPYDPTRHQLFCFGGGHCAWHFNDLNHYSLRTATWSTGYADEYPFAAASFKGFYNQTFTNRPSVPTHLWDAAAYDPVADRVVFCIRNRTWLYNPATREWDYPATQNMPSAIDVSMKSTPKGVVHWNGQAQLHRFEAKSSSWKMLPVSGDRLGAALGDSTGICYDSKRDCLWLANDGGPMQNYDLASGVLTTTPVRRPEFILMRETAYIPEIDMILCAVRVKGLGGEIGNLAYDIGNKKWIGLEIPCVDGKPRTNEKAYSSISLSMHYDPKLNLAIAQTNGHENLVARIEKTGLKSFEIPLQTKKK